MALLLFVQLAPVTASSSPRGLGSRGRAPGRSRGRCPPPLWAFWWGRRPALLLSVVQRGCASVATADSLSRTPSAPEGAEREYPGLSLGGDRVLPGSCWLRVGGSASTEAGVGGRTARGSAALGLGGPLGCGGGEQGAAKGCPITLRPSHQETRVGLGPHGTFLGDQSSSTTYCLLVARRSCSYAGWEQWCYCPTRLWSYHGK